MMSLCTYRIKLTLIYIGGDQFDPPLRFFFNNFKKKAFVTGLENLVNFSKILLDVFVLNFIGIEESYIEPKL